MVTTTAAQMSTPCKLIDVTALEMPVPEPFLWGSDTSRLSNTRPPTLGLDG